MLSSTPSLTICNVDVHMGGQEFAVSRTEHRDCTAPRSLRCGPHQGAAHSRHAPSAGATSACCRQARRAVSPRRPRPASAPERAAPPTCPGAAAVRCAASSSLPVPRAGRHGTPPPRVAPVGCRLPAAPSCPRALSLLRATDPAPAPHAVGGGFVGVWGDNCIFGTKIAV